MRALLLAALLAQDAGTAPPLNDAPFRMEKIEPGQAVPAPGCWLDEQSCIAMGQRWEGVKAERDALKTQLPPPPVVLLVIFFVGAAAGAGAVALFSAGR